MSDNTPPRGVARLTVGQWFGVLVGFMAVLATLGIVLGAISIQGVEEARTEIVDRIDPADRRAQRLIAALSDQETGLRGFALTDDEQFLQPYRGGLAVQQEETRRISALLRDAGKDSAALQARFAALRRQVDAWREGYVVPTLANVRSEGAEALGPESLARGKAAFDRIRIRSAQLTDGLARARTQARERLTGAATFRWAAFVILAASLLAGGIAVTLIARRVITGPLLRLTRSVRAVAKEDLHLPVTVEGPRDINELGDDVEAMRRRILDEVALVEAQAVDLQRSNAELEQFAYVASHDLQEPLRKVAGFTQLLRERYGGQLDERADTYIDFATDGAHRMQALINDLLAFSRVGRIGEAMRPLELGVLLADARDNLEQAIEESGARIEAGGPLPAVKGERPLLTAVLQNLIGNAIKFRRPDVAPVIRIDAERTGEDWEIAVADNGIGIEPQYQDKVFVIFQRLHPKAAYPGTGIGLAMTRKIVEYHGGTVWLDTDRHDGTTFRFTLPAHGD